MRRSAVAGILTSLLGFVLIESLVFRSGWYNQWLDPGSSAGVVEGHMHWLAKTPRGDVAEAIVLGDSRIDHGLSAPGAGAASGNRMRFWNFGIAGTLPRDWFYILRDADPDRHRFAAVILALDQYSDEDYYDVFADRILDLNFVVGRLRIGDCWEFASSMKSRENRSAAFKGCIFKGIALARDAREFLTHGFERRKRARDWREGGLRSINGFEGMDRNLRGLSADWEHRTIAFPPGIDEQTRVTIQATVMPALPPYSAENTRYRERWLSKIFDLYKDSPTKVIFIELPRAPLPKPESATPAVFLTGALRRERVLALDRSTFRDLERPEFFFDGLHLNREGRAIFSARMGEKVPRMVGIQ